MKISVFLLTLVMALGLQAQVYQLPEVDTAPTFAKGKMTSDDFLRLYLNYPEAEYNSGTQGTVGLMYTVDAFGMVTDVVVKTSLTPALDKEALRVASLFPFYTPATKAGANVAVNIQFPVHFYLDKAKVVASTPTAAAPTVVSNSNEPKNPLYVVDGKVLEENANIDPADIKKIRVVKGQKGVDLYGNRAKDGLILIETK